MSAHKTIHKRGSARNLPKENRAEYEKDVKPTQTRIPEAITDCTNNPQNQTFFITHQEAIMILEALKLTEAAKIARKNAKNATKQKEALFLPIFVSTPSKGENGKRKVRYLDPYLSAVIRHT